jgi:hypothetical protein
MSSHHDVWPHPKEQGQVSMDGNLKLWVKIKLLLYTLIISGVCYSDGKLSIELTSRIRDR